NAIAVVRVGGAAVVDRLHGAGPLGRGDLHPRLPVPLVEVEVEVATAAAVQIARVGAARDTEVRGATGLDVEVAGAREVLRLAGRRGVRRRTVEGDDASAVIGLDGRLAVVAERRVGDHRGAGHVAMRQPEPVTRLVDEDALGIGLHGAARATRILPL